jgi:hypothetical protein
MTIGPFQRSHVYAVLQASSLIKQLRLVNALNQHHSWTKIIHVYHAKVIGHLTSYNVSYVQVKQLLMNKNNFANVKKVRHIWTRKINVLSVNLLIYGSKKQRLVMKVK